MILAIQTADATTHLALYDPSKPPEPKSEISWESGRQLADQLLGRLDELLAEQSEHTLTGIVIFSGPGSFTSLRIGHTVANALADSLNIPIAGAVGDNWAQQAIEALASAPIGHFALPHYGAEANVTKPKP
jgi:tRNA threonylcarbamoyladenosine biosynthesis protein TsaB